MVSAYRQCSEEFQSPCKQVDRCESLYRLCGGSEGQEHDASAKGTAEESRKNVEQKSGLNSAILGPGWGQLSQMLEYGYKDVIKVSAGYTSQRCAVCGTPIKRIERHRASSSVWPVATRILQTTPRLQTYRPSELGHLHEEGSFR